MVEVRDHSAYFNIEEKSVIQGTTNPLREND